MTHTNKHPQDYNHNYPIVSQLTRLCKGCGGSVYPNLHTDVLECLQCKGVDWEWVQEDEAEDYRDELETKQHDLAFEIVADVKPALDDVLTLLSIVDETNGDIPEPVQLPITPFAMSPRVGDDRPWTSVTPSADELAKRYDWTPNETMPVIDMDKIGQIEF